MLGKGGFVAYIKAVSQQSSVVIKYSDKNVIRVTPCLQLLRPNVMLSDFIVFISPFDCWTSSVCDGNASVCLNDQVETLQFGLALTTASARN